jgi:catechol 2,3-dioxygenase-like lactoylglutathione lyase family enzyme
MHSIKHLAFDRLNNFQDMIEFKRLDHIQICIPYGQEEKARRFYTDIIGLTEIPKPESLLVNGGMWYMVGDIELHIGTEAGANEPSKRHPAFEIANLEAARKHLSDHGVSINEEIPIPGRLRFTFTDPFNNKVELLQKN